MISERALMIGMSLAALVMVSGFEIFTVVAILEEEWWMAVVGLQMIVYTVFVAVLSAKRLEQIERMRNRNRCR